MAGLLQEFLRSPRSIGAIAPSSGALAEAMLSPLDLPRRGTVLELGPGTGALTEHIAPRLGPWHRYLGVEINGSFVRALQRRFPALDFAHASVEDLDRILRERDWPQVDAVVSALPWASLPQTLQDRVFSALSRHRGPGAGFATFAYVQGLLLPGGQALRRRMANEFSTVERSPIVWRNLPPAIVYIGRW
jgi:phospholipid N-methyltransferase